MERVEEPIDAQEPWPWGPMEGVVPKEPVSQKVSPVRKTIIESNRKKKETYWMNQTPFPARSACHSPLRRTPAHAGKD